jgi:MFS family permease
VSANGATAAPGDGRRSILVVFVGLMLVLLMAALDQTIVSTALPTIVGDLGGLTHISWVVTAYLLAQTAVTPVYGKLGDLYGRKVVLQVALVVFLIGSALCGASQSLTELIVFRGVQGLARLCAGWAPEQHADLAGLLSRLARELAGRPDAEVAAPA